MPITKLYRDHAELDEKDSSTDCATETGHRCQVGCTIEAEISPEEGKDGQVIKEVIMPVSWNAGLVWVRNVENWKDLVESSLGSEGENWQLEKSDPEIWEQETFK
jgi:hypothetical protein